MTELVYSFDELREKLISEHDDSYYYRGQNRIFHGPLWPSMYRLCKPTADVVPLPTELLRLSRLGRGTHFGFMTKFLRENMSEDDRQNLSIKRVMMGHVRNALGYCLAEAFFQQAGWSSEGLDVTDNLDIAFFFASCKWDNGAYVFSASNDDNLAVIYRWRIEESPDWSFPALNTYSFHKMPALFPSKRIINLFETCETDDELILSIEEYRDAISWCFGLFDLSSLQGKRPYHLLRMPRRWLTSSRIVNQHAALLFPDTIPIEPFLNKLRDQRMLEEVQGGMFVEDLSKAYRCEVLRFASSPLAIEILRNIKDAIYPFDDLTHYMLKGWMKALYWSPRWEFTLANTRR